MTARAIRRDVADELRRVEDNVTLQFQCGASKRGTQNDISQLALFAGTALQG